MNDSTDGWLPSFAQVSGDITEIFEQRFPKQLETGAYGRRKNRKNQFILIVTEEAHFLCSHALYQRIYHRLLCCVHLTVALILT